MREDGAMDLDRIWCAECEAVFFVLKEYRDAIYCIRCGNRIWMPDAINEV